MIGADGCKGGYTAGIVTGVGRNHARPKNREVGKQAFARCNVAYTASAAPQQASPCGPHRCSSFQHLEVLRRSSRTTRASVGHESQANSRGNLCRQFFGSSNSIASSTVIIPRM